MWKNNLVFVIKVRVALIVCTLYWRLQKSLLLVSQQISMNRYISGLANQWVRAIQLIFMCTPMKLDICHSCL